MTILRPFFLLALLPLFILNSSCSDDRLNFQVVCGNAIIETGEECDEGKEGNKSGLCTPHCLKAFCGDGFVQDGFEICDNGQLNSDTLPNQCRTNCAPSRCGDGVIDEGEQCDNGTANTNSGTDNCRLNCLYAYCGDGIVDVGEECDDGNLDDTDNCTHFCLPPHCGDGFIHAGSEECDQGPLNSDSAPNGCRSNCASAFCGDGVTDSGEECDPHDTSENLNCTSACELCNVSLLLPFDQLNDSEGEAAPNLFEDISGNGLTPIARETHLGHGLPYTHIYDYVNGTGSVYFPWLSYLEIPHSERLQEAMNFGNSDFTIEFFKWSGHAADTSYDQGILGCYGSWDFQIGQTTAYLRNFTWAYVQPLNVWQHVAIVRHNHQWSLYVDGVALPQAGTANDDDPVYQIEDSTPLPPCTGPFVIGHNNSLNRSWWKGQMDDLRITKGEARYTENFTPPAETLLGCE